MSYDLGSMPSADFTVLPLLSPGYLPCSSDSSFSIFSRHRVSPVPSTLNQELRTKLVPSVFIWMCRRPWVRGRQVTQKFWLQAPRGRCEFKMTHMELKILWLSLITSCTASSRMPRISTETFGEVGHHLAIPAAGRASSSTRLGQKWLWRNQGDELQWNSLVL